MTPDDLREFRDRDPFVPFRLVFTDGRSVEIPHRDFLIIGKRTVEVFVSADPVGGVSPQTFVASALHVVRVEVAQGLAPAGGFQ
jgi:hypothetical protein